MLAACREVGRPIFFSVLIMLLSFLPVFALGGLEGKMFHPLAFTKSFAMLGVGLLAITLVPALCTVFVRGRLRSEEEVGLVRGLMRVYRPVLAYLLDRPAAIVWFVGLTFVLGAAPLGDDRRSCRCVVALAVGASVWARVTRTHDGHRGRDAGRGRAGGRAVDDAAAARVPRRRSTRAWRWTCRSPSRGCRSTQAADDLKARDMVLCRFPEVDMVVGKAGRAETPTDPAPLDMIETMVDFRPREFWPRRCLRPADAERQAAAVLECAGCGRDHPRPGDAAARRELANARRDGGGPALRRPDARGGLPAQQGVRARSSATGRRGSWSQRLIELARPRRELFSRRHGRRARSRRSTRCSLLHAAHLGMEPTPEAVAALVRDALRKLAELRRDTAGDRAPAALRPGFASRVTDSVRVLRRSVETDRP